MKNSKEIAATVFKKRDEHLKNSMIKRRRMKKYAYVGSIACLCAIVVAVAANLLNNNNGKLPFVSDTFISEFTQSYTVVEEITEDSYIQSNTSNNYNNSEPSSVCASSVEQKSSSIRTEKSTDGEATNVDTKLSNGNQTQTSTSNTSEFMTENETVRERRWNEKKLTQQFPEFSYQNTMYGLRDAIIENDYIGDSIGNVSLTGYDVYEDKSYIISANIYQITDISNQAAIALRFENTSSYYVYFNRNYIPNTLGMLIDDLKMESLLVIETMYVNGNIPVDNFPADAMIDLILDSRECECTTDDVIHNTVVSFSASIPLLGIKNKSVALTKDGYIITNIMENNNQFYIGEAKVNEICEILGVYDISYTNTVVQEPQSRDLVLE